MCILPANQRIHACRKRYDAHVSHMHTDLGNKKAINIKPSIYIKFGFHHYLFHDKIFKTRPHLPIFAQYFLKKSFSLILNNYFRILGTNNLTTRTNNYFYEQIFYT